MVLSSLTEDFCGFYSVSDASKGKDKVVPVLNQLSSTP
jgi:hypothetical protein